MKPDSESGLKPVLVIWHDAHAGPTTWESIHDVEDDGPYVVRSVGYLLKPGRGGKKGHISIVQSMGIDQYVDSILYVPVKMVKQIIELSEVSNASTSSNDNKDVRVSTEG